MSLPANGEYIPCVVYGGYEDMMMMNYEKYWYLFHLNNYSLDGGCYWWDLIEREMFDEKYFSD